MEMNFRYQAITNDDVVAVTLPRPVEHVLMTSDIAVWFSLDVDTLTSNVLPNKKGRHPGGGAQKLLKQEGRPFATVYLKRFGNSGTGNVDFDINDNPQSGAYLNAPVALQGQAGPRGVTLVAEDVIESGAENLLSVSDLDLDADKQYLVAWGVANDSASASAVFATFNADTAQTGYNRIPYGGGAADTNTSALAEFAVSTQYDSALGSAIITKLAAANADGGDGEWHIVAQQIGIANVGLTDVTAAVKKVYSSDTNLTALALRATETGVFGAGSFLRVYAIV